MKKDQNDYGKKKESVVPHQLSAEAQVWKPSPREEDRIVEAKVDASKLKQSKRSNRKEDRTADKKANPPITKITGILRRGEDSTSVDIDVDVDIDVKDTIPVKANAKANKKTKSIVKAKAKAPVGDGDGHSTPTPIQASVPTPMKTFAQDKGKRKDKSKIISIECKDGSLIKKKEINQEKHDGTVCLICTKDMKFASIGPCDHAVCVTCSHRLRVQMDTRFCSLCKQDIPIAIVYNTMTKGKKQIHRSFASFGLNPFETDGQKMQGANRDFDILSSMMFISSRDQFISQRTLREWRCPLPQCNKSGPRSGILYRDAMHLQKHFKSVHSQYSLCICCTENRSLFPSEQEFFSSTSKLIEHIRQSPHPSCQFCGKHFFDAQALMKHLNDRHHLCPFCPRNENGQLIFYSDSESLDEHLTSSHMCCKICRNLNVSSGISYEYAFSGITDLETHLVNSHSLILKDLSANSANNTHNLSTIGSGLGFFCDDSRVSKDHTKSKSGKYGKGAAAETPRVIVVDTTARDPNHLHDKLTSCKSNGVNSSHQQSMRGDATLLNLGHMKVIGKVTGSGVFQKYDEIELARLGLTHNGERITNSEYKSKSSKDTSSLTSSHFKAGEKMASELFPALGASSSSSSTAIMGMQGWSKAVNSKAPSTTPSSSGSIQQRKVYIHTAPLTRQEVDSFRKSIDFQNAKKKEIKSVGINSRAESLRVALLDQKLKLSAFDTFSLFAGIPLEGLNDVDYDMCMDSSIDTLRIGRIRTALKRIAITSNELYPPFMLNWSKNAKNFRLISQMESKLALLFGSNINSPDIVEMKPMPGNITTVLSAYSAFYGVTVREIEVIIPGQSTEFQLQFIRTIDSCIPTLLLSKASQKDVYTLPSTLRANNLPRLYFLVSTTNANPFTYSDETLKSTSGSGGSSTQQRQTIQIKDILRLIYLTATSIIDSTHHNDAMKASTAIPMEMKMKKYTVDNLALVRDVQVIGAGGVFIEFDSIPTAAAIYRKMMLDKEKHLYLFQIETGFDTECFIQRFAHDLELEIVNKAIDSVDPLDLDTSAREAISGRWDLSDELLQSCAFDPSPVEAVSYVEENEKITKENMVLTSSLRAAAVVWTDSDDDDNDDIEGNDGDGDGEKALIDSANSSATTANIKAPSDEWGTFLASRRQSSGHLHNKENRYKLPQQRVESQVAFKMNEGTKEEVSSTTTVFHNIRRQMSDSSNSHIANEGISKGTRIKFDALDFDFDDSDLDSDDDKHQLHLHESDNKAFKEGPSVFLEDLLCESSTDDIFESLESLPLLQKQLTRISRKEFEMGSSGEGTREHTPTAIKFESDSKSNEWACLHCTFVNLTSQLICEICLNTR